MARRDAYFMNLDNKKITIIGAKRSGIALAKLITRLNGKAKISDQGSDDHLPLEVKDWIRKNEIAVEFNGHTQFFIEDSDLLVLSPGVRLDSQPARWAQSKGIYVLGEIEFASQFCTQPIIAITGSNGKTTVTTLMNEVLKAGGYKTSLCGNIGIPFSGCVLDLKDENFVVLEVSSFQLESIHPDGFRPHIAVFLNFNQNHLDRHKDLDEYFAAKKRIFLNQGPNDFAVINAEIQNIRSLTSHVKSKVVYFNAPDDRRGMIQNPNHLAVLAVAQIIGISSQVCQKVFEQFKGVEHRMEWVRCLDGVDFINDSKATTAEAGMWALRQLDRPIVIICGGRDKNIDFSVLTELVEKKVKKMLVIGEAREKIRRTFDHVAQVEECDGIEQAVVRAKESATSGDCVLLSPMCASFDMFKDFEDRGRVFKTIVNNLKSISIHA